MNYKMELYKIETENGEEWVASYPDFNACVGQGKTEIEAISECNANLEVLTAYYKDENIPLPKPKRAEGHSGKVLVRMSKTIHRVATELAEKEGVSLNAYIAEAISEKIGYDKGKKVFEGANININFNPIRSHASRVDRNFWDENMLLPKNTNTNLSLKQQS